MHGKGGTHEIGAIWSNWRSDPETVHCWGPEKGHFQTFGTITVVNVRFTLFRLLGKSKSSRNQNSPKCGVI